MTTTNALRDSIQHALDNREEALAYAMQFARDLDPSLANRFVGMYVNERTLNYGEDGREAIKKLLDLGYERGIIPHEADVDSLAKETACRALNAASCVILKKSIDCGQAGFKGVASTTSR